MSLLSKLESPVFSALKPGQHDLILKAWREDTVTSKATDTAPSVVYDTIVVTVANAKELRHLFEITLFEKDVPKFLTNLQNTLHLEGLSGVELINSAIANSTVLTSTFELNDKYENWYIGWVRPATTTSTTVDLNAVATTAKPKPRR